MLILRMKILKFKEGRKGQSSINTSVFPQHRAASARISLEVESELESERERQWVQGHWVTTDDEAHTEGDSDVGRRSRGSRSRQLIQSAIDLGKFHVPGPVLNDS